MPRICNKPLKPNPFVAYRDETGKWMVMKSPVHSNLALKIEVINQKPLLDISAQIAEVQA